MCEAKTLGGKKNICKKPKCAIVLFHSMIRTASSPILGSSTHCVCVMVISRPMFLAVQFPVAILGQCVWEGYTTTGKVREPLSGPGRTPCRHGQFSVVYYPRWGFRTRCRGSRGRRHHAAGWLKFWSCPKLILHFTEVLCISIRMSYPYFAIFLVFCQCILSVCTLQDKHQPDFPLPVHSSHDMR